MKKWTVLALALLFVLILAGCAGAQRSETVTFQNQTFRKADLSEDTLQWLEWYNTLSETEQLAISYIPADLHALRGYANAGEAAAQYQFRATVLEITDTYLLVEPAQDSNERNCSDKIKLILTDQPSWPIPQIGDLVNVVYDGIIQELYPTQIPHIYRVEILLE